MKFTIRIAFILVILLLLFSWIAGKLDKYYQSNYVVCNKNNWIFSKKEQAYDFAVIGSSRALNSVFVPLLEDSLHARGINLGLSGANFAENYIVLREFLNKGNTLKVLYIQTDIYGMDSPSAYSYPFNDYNYIFLLDDDTVAAAFKDHVNIIKYFLWKYIPYAKYAEFSNQYSMYKYLKKGYSCSPIEWDKNSGSELLGQKRKKANLFVEEKNASYTYKINALDSIYLDRMISYCVKNRIIVRAFTSPEKPAYIKKQANRDQIYKAINSICQYYHIPPCYTWDIEKNAAITTHFRDNTHLDSIGARNFSSLLALKMKNELSNIKH